jgi:uncharacterized membrane protein
MQNIHSNRVSLGLPRSHWPSITPLIALLGWMILGTLQSATAETGAVSDSEIMQILRRHCAMCHSQNPSHTMLQGQPPPKDVVLETIDDVRRLADRIRIQAVKLQHMPFGNETAMSPEERARVARWLDGN